MGGLNAKDTLSLMPPTDAVELINWIPDAFGVRSRKGYREWAVNLGAAVRSIFSYFGPGTSYPAVDYTTAPTSMPGAMFAATDSGIYTVTNTTDAPAVSRALSGTTYAGWISSLMLSNVAGTFLCCVSETDGYFFYNGTTWTTVTMGAGANQISGVDPATFCHVSAWKRRLWFVQKNTTKAWYLPTDSIAGAATSFDFGAMFKMGGYLAYLASWTIDAGEGIDDYLVAVSNNGEVVVYKGSDPASASTFSSVGTWKIGQIPIGRRAYIQYGGDLLLIGGDGLYPMSFVTRGGSSMLSAGGQEYASNIKARLGPILRYSFTSRGWDMVAHPTERIIMINVPNTRGYKDSQFAMTTTTNKWCLLQDIPCSCFGQSGGYVFTGTSDGRVLLLFSDILDSVYYGEPSSGLPIYGLIEPAFNGFGTPAQKKRFTMVKPHFIAITKPGIIVRMLVDYTNFGWREYALPPTLEFSKFNTGRWNSATWTSYLGTAFADWVGVGAVGGSATVALHTACVGDSVLSAIDYMYVPGGPL